MDHGHAVIRVQPARRRTTADDGNDRKLPSGAFCHSCHRPASDGQNPGRTEAGFIRTGRTTDAASVGAPSGGAHDGQRTHDFLKCRDPGNTALHRYPDQSR